VLEKFKKVFKNTKGRYLKKQDAYFNTF